LILDRFYFKMTARRIRLDMKSMEARFPGYAGSSYSDLLGTVYSFRAEKDQLTMHHRKYGDIQMQPVDDEEFLCSLGFLKFTSSPKGEVLGFVLTPSDERFCFQGVEFKKIR